MKIKVGLVFEIPDKKFEDLEKVLGKTSDEKKIAWIIQKVVGYLINSEDATIYRIEGEKL